MMNGKHLTIMSNANCSITGKVQCVPLAGSPGKCWFTRRKKYITFAFIPVMKCGCVFFGNSQKGSWQQEKIRYRYCFHVVVKMYRHSLEERVSLWRPIGLLVPLRIASGGLLNSLVAKTRRRNAYWHRERQASCVAVSFRPYYLYLISSFRVANFLFANSQNTQPHFITGMTSKCILLFFL
jgi:hypothetical protein